MAYHQSQPQSYVNSGYPENATRATQPSKERYDYHYVNDLDSGPSGARRLSPRTWSKRTKVIVGAIIAAILVIVVVVGAVVGTRNSRYPDYSQLTYNHADTCKSPCYITSESVLPYAISVEPATFFENFQYWGTYDPAQGFVHYDTQSWSTNPTYNTTFVSPDAAYVQVDRTDPQAVTGRHSARVSSLKQYNDGLFLFDIKHSPYGCATWPAIWLSDQFNWPNNGEIDVVEAVNQATTGVQSTLHTTKDCTMNVKRKQSGAVAGTNCWNGTDANAGCGVTGPPSTYGQAFNQAGGGVYACELRKEGIRVWFFPRASLPGDVAASINAESNDAIHPDPSKWPEALADFPSTDCDISSHFRNQSIIVNIDLCGQWAGRVYNTEDQCPGSCQQFVTSNPTAFNDAYWALGRFKVYQA